MIKLIDWIRNMKKSICFKYIVVIIVMIVFAFAINLYRQNKYQQNEQEQIYAAESQSEDDDKNEQNFFLTAVKENKAHIVALSIVSVGLLIVKYKQKHRIKESR